MPNTNSMGVGDIADFIPELWANEAIGRLSSQMNLARTVNRNFDNTPQRYGDTIYVPKRGALTANSKATDTDVTKQFPQSDKVTVNLNQHWEVTFSIDNVAEAQANQDVMGGYIQDGVIALAEKVEETIAALYTSAGNTVSAGSDVGKDDILDARKILVDNKVPKMAPKYGYFSTDAINDLLQVTEFINVRDYGRENEANPVLDGELGTIYGIKIFESQLVETSGSPATFHNLVYGPDAMILAFRPLPMAPEGIGVRQAVVQDEESGLGLRVSYSWDKDQLAMQVTIDCLFGVAVMRAEHLVDVQNT